MRKKAIVLALLCLSLAAPSSYTSQQSPPPPPDEAVATLDKSYELGGRLNELDRLRQWNNLIIETPAIAPDRVSGWAKKLIEDAINSPTLPAWDKIAYQKNAIVALSKVDPDGAMDAFSKIGPAAASKSGNRSEDVRAFGARIIFFNYWRKNGINGLPRIRTEALRLPQTNGAYPFHAISLIIAELGAAKDTKALAGQLFDEAVRNYKCPSPVENQDDDFLTLLQNTRSVIELPTFKSTVHEFVHHLSACNAKTGDVLVGFIKTSKGTVPLTDDNQRLLFEAYSLIKAVDTDLATQLRDQNPELDKADAVLEQVVGSYVNATLPPEKQAALQKQGLQRSFLRAINNQQRTSPQAALELTNMLDDPTARLIATASVVPDLAQSNLTQAKQIYAQQLNLFENSATAGRNLDATLAMAKAAYGAEDFDNCQYLGNIVLSDAMAEFEASYQGPQTDPPKMVDGRPGYRQLTNLIEFEAAHGINSLFDQLESVTDDRLKAHLLLYAAKGMAHK